MQEHVDYADGGFRDWLASSTFETQWADSVFDVQNIITFTEGFPQTGATTTTYTDLIDPDLAFTDGLSSLLSAWRTPAEISSTINFFNPFSNFSGYRRVTGAGWQTLGYLDSRPYFWRITPDPMLPGYPNYVKIVWDVARVVWPLAVEFPTDPSSDAESAAIVDSDLEYEFLNILNYGDSTDPSRQSGDYDMSAYMAGETPLADKKVTWHPVNVRVYPAKGRPEYKAVGWWFDGTTWTEKAGDYEQ